MVVTWAAMESLASVMVGWTGCRVQQSHLNLGDGRFARWADGVECARERMACVARPFAG